MALTNLTKVQTVGIGSNIEVVGVVTTGQFKSGTSNLHSTGIELTNLNVSGIATIGGNLSIGGTLTYQDVTNIDSVGIITARSTIDAQGDVSIADKIIHTGDTNTAIRFPAVDTITFETAGSEKLRIASNGLHTINATTYEALTINTTNNGVNGPEVQLMHTSTSPAANDIVGQLRYSGKDSAGNTTLYSKIETKVDDPTDGQETGFLDFSTRGYSAYNSIFRLKNRGSASAPSYTADDMNGIILDVYNTGNPYPRYMNLIAKSAGNTDSNIAFWTEAVGGSPTEKLRITSDGNVLLSKTSTSDYGKLEVKGGTADNIETSDITAKTVATFSGSTPGTTAAGKGVGIVIKPISNRGCNYFFGVAGDSANQESHGRFIIRSGNFAGTTSERLRIDSSGHITPGTDNSQHIGNGTTNFNSIWASTRFRGNDNVKLVLGNSQDFVIYHDGSGTNFINSPQGGSLHIKSGTGDNANLKHIQCDYNGNTIIYHQNAGSAAARITTTNAGITFGGEVTFSSGQNVRTFAGAVYLTDGQHADVVTHTGGYAWAFFEFYGISYHGSIGRCRWHGSMSRYGNDDNYPTINNSMGYFQMQRVTDSSNANRRSIRIQRTGTYGGVWCNYYIRCYAANSTAGWDAGTGATKKYEGN